MSNTSYVKLGSGAHIFCDMSTGLTITNDQVVIATNRHKASKKYKKAISGGHLSIATESEYEAFKKLNAERKANITKDDSVQVAELKKVAQGHLDTISTKDEEIANLKAKLEAAGKTPEDDDPLDKMETIEEAMKYLDEELSASKKIITKAEKITDLEELKNYIKTYRDE